jgi:hypothetical protein
MYYVNVRCAARSLATERATYERRQSAAVGHSCSTDCVRVRQAGTLRACITHVYDKSTRLVRPCLGLVTISSSTLHLSDRCCAAVRDTDKQRRRAAAAVAFPPRSVDRLLNIAPSRTKIVHQSRLSAGVRCQQD